MKAGNTPQDDLVAIRQMMERSSKFLSLSGLSGVFAGMCALAGAAIAYYIILDTGNIQYDEYIRSLGNESTQSIRGMLFADALIVLMMALGGAVFFSMRKAKLNHQKVWSKSTKNLLIYLSIPLITGGLFSILLIWHNNVHLVAATTLIFYGLALVNAGKFTFGEIHYLGLSEIVLGLLAGVFIHYGLLIWTIGFGLMHIIYGLMMYLKYEK